MVGLEDDIEAQKKGVVVILHAYQFDDTRMGEIPTKICSIFFKALPWKPMGIHYCCSREEMLSLRPFEQHFQLLIGQEGRKRFRAHNGKPKHAPFPDVCVSIGISDTADDLTSFPLKRLGY
jgi:hypothetical protein